MLHVIINSYAYKSTQVINKKEQIQKKKTIRIINLFKERDDENKLRNGFNQNRTKESTKWKILIILQANLCAAKKITRERFVNVECYMSDYYYEIIHCTLLEHLVWIVLCVIFEFDLQRNEWKQTIANTLKALKALKSAFIIIYNLQI